MEATMTLSRGKMNVNGWCPISRNKLSPLQPDLWLIDFNDMYRPLESTSIYKVFAWSWWECFAFLFNLFWIGTWLFQHFHSTLCNAQYNTTSKIHIGLASQSKHMHVHVCWLNDSPCITVCYYNLSQLTTQSPRAPTPTVGSSSGSDSSAWR